MPGRSKSPGSLLNVGAACRRLGIGPHTLRAWETRYLAVQPERSATGHRFYSAAELERLEKLVRLVNLGHSIGSIATLADKDLALLLDGSKRDAEGASEKLDEDLLVTLHAALERFDVHAIASLLEQRRTAMGIRAFVLHVFLPLLRSTGLAIAKGRLSIAHEHALSAVLKDQLYQSLRYGTQPVLASKAERFVLATPEDDLHEFGILMASALLAHYRLSCHFLGANLPAEALGLAVKAVDGTVVILGHSPVPEGERAVPFEDYLQVVHRALPKHVEIWIGGAGAVPHLRRVMPGRACKTLRSMEELDALFAKVESRRREES